MQKGKTKERRLSAKTVTLGEAPAAQQALRSTPPRHGATAGDTSWRTPVNRGFEETGLCVHCERFTE
jgi:hypothetical protein